MSDILKNCAIKQILGSYLYDVMRYTGSYSVHTCNAWERYWRAHFRVRLRVAQWHAVLTLIQCTMFIISGYGKSNTVLGQGSLMGCLR